MLDWEAPTGQGRAAYGGGAKYVRLFWEGIPGFFLQLSPWFSIVYTLNFSGLPSPHLKIGINAVSVWLLVNEKMKSLEL